MTVLPELEDQLVRAAAAETRRATPRRIRPSVGHLVPALSVVVTVAIAVGAFALLSHRTRMMPRSEGAGAVVTQRQRAIRLDHNLNLSADQRVSATVIGRNPTLWYIAIEVNRGSQDAVALNDPVIGDGALVGKITTVDANHSTVTLITDHPFAVAARVLDASGDAGVLVSKLGNPNVLLLQDLPNHAQIANGQQVVTDGSRSGALASMFPAGIPIGQVSNANPLNHAQVQVTPRSDLRHLAAVQILTSGHTGNATPSRPQLIRRPPTTRPPARLALTGASLNGVTFGATPDRLGRLLDRVLGRPDGGYRAISDCGVDHELSWPILLNPATGRVARAEELELFFRHGRFVGYQYGGNVLAARGGGFHLRIGALTTRGLAVGDTLAVGQRLYGRDFTISSAQGGTWSARTPDGLLRGYAFGNPKRGDVSPRSLVASIDAGDVGCPALSP